MKGYKKWVFFFFGAGLVIVIFVIILFSAYAANKPEYEEKQQESDEITTEYNRLLARKEKLVKENDNYKNNIRELQEKNSTIYTEYHRLRNIIDPLTIEYNNKFNEYYLTNISLIFSGFATLASGLINVGMAAYDITTAFTISNNKKILSYIRTRYSLSAPYLISHFINKKERSVYNTFTTLYETEDYLDREAFVSALQGRSHTVTVLRTTEEEVIAFVLYSAWNFNVESITDTSSFTVSFRHFERTSHKSGPAVYPKEAFLKIGESEIVINSNKASTAVAGKTYSPTKSTETENFYVSSGSFTLKSISVYSFY